MPKCLECGCERPRPQLLRCPQCDADYCRAHCVEGDWHSVAAGIDYQYCMVTCPKGHEWREESYA